MPTPSIRFLNRVKGLLTSLVLTTALNLSCGSGGGSTSTNTPPATPPAVPLGLTAMGADRQVSLAWNASSGATGYKVKRSGTSGGPYTTEVGAPIATNYINTGLTNGTPYYYVVSAVNNAGESANSSEVSATPTAPPPPGTATSLSQYGITWTFDKAYPVGQFANGDYWVIGPVTIIQILPASRDMGTRGIVHGSMLNPDVSWNQGYDSRMYGEGFASCGFLASLNAARPNGQDLSAQNPLVISTPSSLVSGISTLELAPGSSNQVPTMAVLTVLNAVPPAGSFRPPYVGTDKTIRHTMADLDMSRLPSLTMPSGLSYESFHLSNGDPFTPSGVADKLAAIFQRPWIEHMLGWNKEVFCPRDNMPYYGRQIASRVSDAALALTLDIPTESKRNLAMRLAQYGLDTYGITQRPDGRINWKADGGHMSGRAFPLLFASYIFSDAAMAQVLSKSGQYAYQGGYYAGNLPSDYFHFGEIDQTFYVTSRDIALAHVRADIRFCSLIQYTNDDLGKPEWGILHVWDPEADNNNWDAAYRPTCGISWSGYVLASRIMGLRNAWNHPPLFDYMDRYMQLTVGTDTRTFNQFQARMWDTYRSSY